MSDIGENKKVVQRFISLLGTDDLRGLTGLMDENLQWVIPQDSELSSLAGVRSKSEWAALYAGFKSRVKSEINYKIIGMTAEGERVAVEVEASADTPAGPFLNRYHFLFELRGGLIVTGKEYADSLYMQNFSERMKALSGQ